MEAAKTAMASAVVNLGRALPRLIAASDRIRSAASFVNSLGRATLDLDRVKKAAGTRASVWLSKGVIYYDDELILVDYEAPLRIEVEVSKDMYRRGDVWIDIRLEGEGKLGNYWHYRSRSYDAVEFEVDFLLYLGYLDVINGGALSSRLRAEGIDALAELVELASRYVEKRGEAVGPLPKVEAEGEAAGRLELGRNLPEVKAYLHMISAAVPLVASIRLNALAEAKIGVVKGEGLRITASVRRGATGIFYRRQRGSRLLVYEHKRGAHEVYADHHFMALDALYGGRLSDALVAAAEKAAACAERMAEASKGFATLLKIAGAL